VVIGIESPLAFALGAQKARPAVPKEEEGFVGGACISFRPGCGRLKTDVGGTGKAERRRTQGAAVVGTGARPISGGGRSDHVAVTVNLGEM
jgi:hypothetical protein